MQKRTSMSSPLLQVTAMLSGRKLAFAAMKACSMSLGRKTQLLMRRLQNRGDVQPCAHVADGGEIVMRAQAGAGSVLAVFVGREAIVRVEAMLLGQIRGRSVLALARLGVRAVIVVWPQAVDDKAVARAGRALRRRRLLTAKVAEAGGPGQRHHIIVERRASRPAEGGLGDGRDRRADQPQARK